MKEVHIGEEIGKRLQQLRMTKSEFARKLGIPQQNVNRIIDRPEIMTDQLRSICSILDYDFFSLYVDKNDIHVVASGDSSIAALYSDVQTSDSNVLKERIRSLELILMEKERMIQYLLGSGKHDIQP